MTVLVDIITPKLESLLALSYTGATLTQVCFFLAYAVVSLPAGALVARVGSIRGLVLRPVVMAAGGLIVHAGREDRPLSPVPGRTFRHGVGHRQRLVKS